MALIWNAAIFERGRARSRRPAGDLGRRGRLLQADQGQDRQGRLRPGCPQVNAGNTPFRFMPRPGPMAAARSTKPSRTRPTRRSGSTTRAASGGAGLLRHVCPRQIGAGLGPDQHSGRKPGAVHRRPARHDDLASQRIRQDARPGEKATGEDKERRRPWSRTCATA